MRLNWFGRTAMNNALRARFQNGYVAREMERLAPSISGGRVLEVGCGRGVGAEIILDRFRARQVFAFDLDPRMLRPARRRLSRRPARLFLGDVTAIGAATSSFDAAFDFGAVHLVPDWRRAVGEIQRVLKPGGTYFFELVTGRVLRLPYVLVTESFRSMQYPRADEFLEELSRLGMKVGAVRPTLAAWTGLVGDLIGAARKPASSGA